MFRLTLFAVLLTVAVATKVNQCKDGPLPLAVRVKGCEEPPCDVYKGTDVEFQIDFVTDKEMPALTTKTRATALGVTVPFPLPEDVANVCKNLLNGQQCPLDEGEEATYKFLFPVGNYPEIGVNVEISLVNANKEKIVCFKADIQVKKPQ